MLGARAPVCPCCGQSQELWAWSLQKCVTRPSEQTQKRNRNQENTKLHFQFLSTTPAVEGDPSCSCRAALGAPSHGLSARGCSSCPWWRVPGSALCSCPRPIPCTWRVPLQHLNIPAQPRDAALAQLSALLIPSNLHRREKLLIPEHLGLPKHG